MAERMKATSRAIASDPAVRSVNSYLGSQDATMTSLGRLYIVLKPVAERGAIDGGGDRESAPPRGGGPGPRPRCSPWKTCGSAGGKEWE